MFPVYSVTYVPGPYPALRSVGLLDVLHKYACGGLGRNALSSQPFRSLTRVSSLRPGVRNAGQLSSFPIPFLGLR